VDAAKAEEIVKRLIRREWEVATSSGVFKPKPKVLSFGVDLTGAPARTSEFPIRTIKGPVELPQAATNDPSDLPQWAFFEDDDPEANWEHPCRYLFVHEKADTTGKVTGVRSTLPFDTDVNFPIDEVTGIFPEDMR
jgi:hypothetical protein